MKAKMDKVIKGRKIVIGNRYVLQGRIRGATRSRKITKIWGNIGMQDVLRRVQYSNAAINTKFGTLGIKIYNSLGRFSKFRKTRTIIATRSGWQYVKKWKHEKKY